MLLTLSHFCVCARAWSTFPAGNRKVKQIHYSALCGNNGIWFGMWLVEGSAATFRCTQAHTVHALMIDCKGQELHLLSHYLVATPACFTVVHVFQIW